MTMLSSFKSYTLMKLDFMALHFPMPIRHDGRFFFEQLGLEWRYTRIAGRGAHAVKGFELPGLGTPCKRFIVAANEPEAWAIRLAAIYKAAILVGEPYLEEINGYEFQYWYKIVMGQHEQYVFAYCRKCDTTIEFSPAFAETGARFVDAKHKVHRYQYSRGEGWGYCRCVPLNDSPPLPYDPRFLFAAQVAQSHINLPGVGLTIFTDGNM